MKFKNILRRYTRFQILIIFRNISIFLFFCLWNDSFIIYAQTEYGISISSPNSERSSIHQQNKLRSVLIQEPETADKTESMLTSQRNLTSGNASISHQKITPQQNTIKTQKASSKYTYARTANSAGPLPIPIKTSPSSSQISRNISSPIPQVTTSQNIPGSVQESHINRASYSHKTSLRSSLNPKISTDTGRMKNSPAESPTQKSAARSVIPLPQNIRQLSMIDIRQENPEKASYSDKTREVIKQKIPLGQMSPASRHKIQRVLSDVTMYRRLPVEVIPCDEELYDFLTRHPDIIVNIWEFMQIGNMRLTELGEDRFYLEDNAGTKGMIECLFRSKNLLVIYVSGSYEGIPFPNKVSGRGVIILQNEPMTDAEGKRLMAVRMDYFIQIQNGTVDFLAKTFHGTVGRVADNNMNQIMGFIGSLTQTIYYNPHSVQRASAHLKRVRPDVRQEFSNLSAIISQREEERVYGPLPVAASTSQREWGN
ncbi:MAG: hypothetical protein Q4C96_01190 [Planctomycetia bacterium]|nr:hypothetical protein [Planctomycetia bacterium]